MLCGDAMKWNTVWLKKELSTDINKALSMVERFEKEFNELAERFHTLLTNGRHLETVLCTCGVQVGRIPLNLLILIGFMCRTAKNKLKTHASIQFVQFYAVTRFV